MKENNYSGEIIDLTKKYPGSRSEQQRPLTVPDAIHTREQTPLLGLMVRYSGGYIRSRDQAAYVVVTAASLCILGSAYLFWTAVRSPSTPPPDRIIWVPGPKAQPGNQTHVE